MKIEHVADFAITFLIGSSIVFAIAIACMAVSRSLVERKHIATTTLIVLLGWMVCAVMPMPRPLATERNTATGIESTTTPGPVDTTAYEVAVATTRNTSAPLSPITVHSAIAPRTEHPDDDPAQSAPMPATARPIAVIVATLLVLGAILCVSWLVLARLVLHARTARARCAAPDVMQLARSIADAPARLRILVTDEPTRPYCFGLRTPTIMLPANLCDDDRRERLRAVLLHELAHIAARDLRDQALLAVCLPLLYWHPLFWMLRRHLRLAAEQLADRQATERLDPVTYVRELIGLVDLRGSALPLAPIVPVLARESEFYRRMNMLLSRSRFLATRSSRCQRLLRRSGAVVTLSFLALGWGQVPAPAQDRGVAKPDLGATGSDRTGAASGKAVAKPSDMDTLSYRITGTYPAAKQLERMLLLIEKRGFVTSGLRVTEGSGAEPCRFFATISRDVRDRGGVERLLVDLLELRNEMHRARMTIDHLGPIGAEKPQLELVRDTIARHMASVLAVTGRRSTWARTLDQLVTVVANDKHPERHRAWFTSINIRGANDSTQGPTVMLPGAIAGSDIRSLANLHDDVEAAPFWALVLEASPPSGVRRIDASLTPRESFTFAWKWRLKPIGPERVAARPAGETASASATVSEQELSVRYKELLTQASVLPSPQDLMWITRMTSGFATRAGVAIERFRPIRATSTDGVLQSTSYEYEFRASLWQLLELLSFVENQEKLYSVRDLSVTSADGQARDDADAKHSCRLTVETWVYRPDPELEARFGPIEIEPVQRKPYFEFPGRKGRRDVFVDPRAVAK